MRVTAEGYARVVALGKNVAWIVFEEESTPRLASLKRAAGKREMLAPGDLVRARRLDGDRAIVDAREPRTSVLQRRQGGRTKVMAANVDTLATVSALANPPLRLALLDQLLAFAELHELQALVVLTKPDLDAGATGPAVETLYRRLGYASLIVNPKAGDNVDALRDRLAGRHALLTGVSGVGKSSLFRALGGEAHVGEVSRHGLGRQTTTAARLYRTPGGFLIDSPGIVEFGLGTMAPAELTEAFREFREPSRECRFSDCTHLREPGCGVRAALDSGTIAGSRYESYARILGGC